MSESKKGSPIPAQQSPALAVHNGWDEEAYKSVCDNLEQWKSRALEAEILLDRIRNDMAPTHMGEPLIVPDDWKLVPIKEDVEMRSAGFSCCDVTAKKVTEIWGAMVSASPKPPIVQSPRITEQDAREIYRSINHKAYMGVSFTQWLDDEGRALLNKLNGDQ